MKKYTCILKVLTCRPFLSCFLANRGSGLLISIISVSILYYMMYMIRGEICPFALFVALLSCPLRDNSFSRLTERDIKEATWRLTRGLQLCRGNPLFLSAHPPKPSHVYFFTARRLSVDLYVRPTDRGGPWRPYILSHDVSANIFSSVQSTKKGVS